MAEGFYRALAKILKQHGCYIARQGKGSHEMWHNPKTNKNFPVPFNIKYRTLANTILKQAEIKEKV